MNLNIAYQDIKKHLTLDDGIDWSKHINVKAINKYVTYNELIILF